MQHFIFDCLLLRSTAKRGNDAFIALGILRKTWLTNGRTDSLMDREINQTTQQPLSKLETNKSGKIVLSNAQNLIC